MAEFSFKLKALSQLHVFSLQTECCTYWNIEMAAISVMPTSCTSKKRSVIFHCIVRESYGKGIMRK